GALPILPGFPVAVSGPGAAARTRIAVPEGTRHAVYPAVSVDVGCRRAHIRIGRVGDGMPAPGAVPLILEPMRLSVHSRVEIQVAIPVHIHGRKGFARIPRLHGHGLEVEGRHGGESRYRER